jgi:dipeptidyl aminopeptidase/acylaminoacyl peptidase
MKRFTRRTVSIIAGEVIVIAIIGVGAYATSKGYDTLTLPKERYAHATPSVQFEDVTFPARGRSYKVYAYYLPGEAGYPVLINVHGRFGSRHQKDTLDRAQAWRSLGYAVLSLDLSDNGGDTVEDGRLSMGFKEPYDVLGAVDYLLTRGFTSDQIGIVSISLGASTSLMAAGQEPRLKAIWEDSGYTRADTVIAEQATRNGYTPLLIPGGMLWGVLTTGDRLWEVAPINLGPLFAANKQAIYITHAEGDETVAYHHGVDLYNAYKAAGVNVTFWGLPPISHGRIFIERRDEYLKRLDEFFHSTLSFK